MITKIKAGFFSDISLTFIFYSTLAVNWAAENQRSDNSSYIDYFGDSRSYSLKNRMYLPTCYNLLLHSTFDIELEGLI